VIGVGGGNCFKGSGVVGLIRGVRLGGYRRVTVWHCIVGS